MELPGFRASWSPGGPPGHVAGSSAAPPGPPPPAPRAAGTHRARRELSWLKVSALTSQMRLCWRPLGQQGRLCDQWAQTLDPLHTPPHLPCSGQKRGEPQAPTSPGLGRECPPSEVPSMKGIRLPRVSGSTDKATHNTAPVVRKGVSLQGSHQAWLPAQRTSPCGSSRPWSSTRAPPSPRAAVTSPGRAVAQRTGGLRASALNTLFLGHLDKWGRPWHPLPGPQRHRSPC